jgi:hypothetical protein
MASSCRGIAMDPKPQPNHQRYLEVLRAMTPEQRLKKAFELTERSRRLFREGLRRRFPELAEAELHKLYIERLHACRNLDD